MQTNSEPDRSDGGEEGARETLDGASGFFEAVQDFDERIRSLARERPFAAVLTAVAVGFVMGRLFAGSGRSAR